MGWRGWFTRKWYAWDVPGHFSIQVPAGTECYFDDDPNAACIRLGKGSRTTEIRIARHPLPPVQAREEYLEDAVREFLERSVPGVSGGERRQASVERCRTRQDAVQGVATGQDKIWWLVRAYDVGDEFVWLQWCGPKRVMVGTVLEVYESFVPVFGESGE